ncbi:hypothetical protein [Kribbella catacumbae]|uniref:hypothetical protein n=1 Tax=Kribbella catacumbae TaxID=460086 RepID=UPI000365FBD4|nr:hypothetical protein [Kribbella catacumbae]
MTLSSSRRRVRLWFGPHQIADFIGEAAHADRYEAAMRRRFPGLQITNDGLRRADGQDILPHR